MAKYNPDHLDNAAESTVDFEAIIAPNLLTLLGNIEGKRALDIGCGTGKYARLLASLRADVTAIDRGFEQIRRARNSTNPDAANIEFIVGNVGANNDLEARFDIVLVMFVVLDTETPEDMIELAGVAASALAPGASLFIADVHPHNFNKENPVEFVKPIKQSSYFSEGCAISSRVLMCDGTHRVFKPSYHYSLGFIINTFCNEGLYLKNLMEPVFKTEFPTHVILEFVKLQ